MINKCLIEWNEKKFSVHITEIDSQHKAWISIINDLHEAMKNKEAKGATLKTIIARLEDYTRFHFATEEKYFEQLNYPEKDTHKKAHQSLLEKIKEMKNRISCDLLFASDIYYPIKDWLINHICVTDKAYSRFFNEHGIK